jgi:hypothetical protein
MKTIQFKLTFILILSIGLLVTSCIDDDDFETPDLNVTEPVIDGEIIDISSVLNIIEQNREDGDEEDELQVEVEVIENDIYVEGYVISSDEAGNFFEEIIIQDKPVDPTAGIRISVNANPLFSKFDVGRRILVKLKGLAVGEENGIAVIGRQEGLEVGQIQENQVDEFILRTPIVETIVPKVIQISTITDIQNPQNQNIIENTFVQLQNVQFPRNIIIGDNLATFANEENDQFDGERPLESCDSGNSLILSTSTFADFRFLNLPTGSGSISGVLSRDFFNDFYILAINTTETINFDQERCDPGEFSFSENPVDCSNTDINGATTLFFEDFESFANPSELTEAGWTLINLEGGGYNWGLDDFSNNNYALANAFGTDQPAIDAWLITPPIDLSGTTEEELNFQVQTNFDGGEVLSVWVSTDFQSVEDDSNWSLLGDVEIPEGPAGGFGSFEDVNPVNLSCIEGGTVRIGFRYQGSDPGITTRYHVDNIEVTGN